MQQKMARLLGENTELEGNLLAATGRAEDAAAIADELVDRLAVKEQTISDQSDEIRTLKAQPHIGVMTTISSEPLLGKITRLPKDVESILPLIESLSGGRVVFTERARRSARALKRVERRYVDAVWCCLSALGSELFDLVFNSEGPMDVEKAFRSRTGLELALTAGKMTKKDPRLVNLRCDEYEGLEIDISPHVKVRVGHKHIRVYFHIDRAKNRVVIGHVGKHLQTYATRMLH